MILSLLRLIVERYANLVVLIALVVTIRYENLSNTPRSRTRIQGRQSAAVRMRPGLLRLVLEQL